jgi:hypothetical protein
LVEPLDLGPRPGCTPKELQAAGNARITIEAADVDSLAHGIPAIVRDQIGEDSLEGDAVHRIRVFSGHSVQKRWSAERELRARGQPTAAGDSLNLATLPTPYREMDG